MPVEGAPLYPVLPGAADSEWVSYPEAEAEIGKDNLVKLADLNNKRDPVEIATVIQRAMNLASEQVNTRFRSAGYQIPLATQVGQDSSVPWTTIRLAAAKIVHWQLYNQRGKRDNDREGDHMTEKYQWAIDQLDWLIDQDLPLILQPGVEESRNQTGQIKTIKINRARVNRAQSDEFARPY